MAIELNACPNCKKPLRVTELACPRCDIKIQGQFERGCKFCSLEPEQRRLLEVFLQCRGVIRDMERVLGVSYPTVKARLDALFNALGYEPVKVESKEELASRRREVLDRLEAGEITAEEAARALKDIGK